MKKKYTPLQICNRLLVISTIILIAVCLMIPIGNKIVESICASEHKEAFLEAHYTGEPQIFIDSLLNQNN